MSQLATLAGGLIRATAYRTRYDSALHGASPIQGACVSQVLRCLIRPKVPHEAAT